MIEAIRHWEERYSRLTDEETRKIALQLRGRARGGESLDRLLPEVFGLVCVASTRTLKMRPFDVQLVAGVVDGGRVFEREAPREVAAAQQASAAETVAGDPVGTAADPPSSDAAPVGVVPC